MTVACSFDERRLALQRLLFLLPVGTVLVRLNMGGESRHLRIQGEVALLTVHSGVTWGS